MRNLDDLVMDVNLLMGGVTLCLLLIIGVSEMYDPNVILFRQPKLLVSAGELADPQRRNSTRWPMPGLTSLKVFWYETVVGNLGNKDRKTLQDDHRDDSRDEAVGDIERNFSEF